MSASRIDVDVDLRDSVARVEGWAHAGDSERRGGHPDRWAESYSGEVELETVTLGGRNVTRELDDDERAIVIAALIGAGGGL